MPKTEQTRIYSQCESLSSHLLDSGASLVLFCYSKSCMGGLVLGAHPDPDPDPDPALRDHEQTTLFGIG